MLWDSSLQAAIPSGPELYSLCPMKIFDERKVPVVKITAFASYLTPIALKNRNLNMNALMFCAAIGALLIGHWPEVATVMVLFSLTEK